MRRSIVLALLCIFALVGLSDRSSAEFNGTPPHWKYAVFRMVTVDGTSTFQWYETDNHYESQSFEKFLQLLPFHTRGHNSGSKVIDVLNYAGDAGWELTTSDITRTEHTENERFFLKQQIP